MDTGIINLFVYDTKENFEKTKHLLGHEGATLKKIFNIESLEEFKRIIEVNLTENDYIFLVVHVWGKTGNLKGIADFKASGIIESYPNLDYMNISEGNKDEDIKIKMIQNKHELKDVYFYHQVRDELKNDKRNVFKKHQLLNPNNLKAIDSKKMKFDYAIITALEEHEMKKVLEIVEKEGSIDNDKHLLEYGHIKGNKSKKVLYASQQATGMIDAAILSTELLQFEPNYLIMAGVLGGRPDKTEIGDVIIATSTFTIDKGKIDKSGFHIEPENSNVEHSGITKIKRAKEDIKEYLRREDGTRVSKIDIHFGPIGCVRQVIDLEEWFAKKITKVDRKAIALEMESYAVSRSCQLVNNGKTKALIIKSVMDNTQQKVDDGKPYAAWSSAMTIKYILENDII